MQPPNAPQIQGHAAIRALYETVTFVSLGVGPTTVRVSASGDLAAIWQESLGMEAIGRHDHFFELGGHSLSLMQVHSRIRERLRVETALLDLFVRPLLSAQAELISALQLEAFLGDDMAAMSDELDDLSEDELLTLLERESVND